MKLALSASRVMALHCSPEGLLFRQIAQPGSDGSYVEVWDPRSARLAGTIPIGARVLLDVRDHVLYLGSVPARHKFMLEPVRYELARPDLRRVAG